MPDREDPQDQPQSDPLEVARLREKNAAAEIKEQEAAKLRAEAEEARHRADREPSRQTQALAAGWIRIALAIVFAIIALVMLILGYPISPFAYAPATLAGFVLRPLRPREG